MISMNNCDQHYENVERFNTVAGNLDSVDVKSINAQMGFIAEEFVETEEALAAGDNVELLDGACDLFVTVAGLLQKLEVAGYDVDTALSRVCKNNLSKFPRTGTVDIPSVCPDNTQTVMSRDGRLVFKRADGKVLKPKNFVPVDLSDLVPNQQFFGGVF